MRSFADVSCARSSFVVVLGVVAALCGPSLHAQSAAPKAKAGAVGAKAAVAPALAGVWTGTATVPLPDSAIVVPVIYTFTQSGTTIGGTAVVPGQGSGAISNVTRSGARLQFRVTAPENRLLEHDGTFAADGSLEGMVNMNNQPVAKFKIAPKPTPKPAK
ncbi:MAG: hypothetical protein IT353_17480 [Gemmatimonadaceae bacterium]|nr:hypothetical protein [Gemmatimonadaceae bacterium]